MVLEDDDSPVPALLPSLVDVLVGENGGADSGFMDETKSVLLYICLCPRAKSQCFLVFRQAMLQGTKGEVVDRHVFRK